MYVEMSQPFWGRVLAGQEATAEQEAAAMQLPEQQCNVLNHHQDHRQQHQQHQRQCVLAGIIGGDRPTNADRLDNVTDKTFCRRVNVCGLWFFVAEGETVLADQ